MRWAGLDVSPTAQMLVSRSGVDLDAVERALIRFALGAHDGNQTRAAAFLGVSRSALIYRMQKHGIGLTDGRAQRSEAPADAGPHGEESAR